LRDCNNTGRNETNALRVRRVEHGEVRHGEDGEESSKEDGSEE
jgi:hypothetical protein